jgi:hypothetical protein
MSVMSRVCRRMRAHTHRVVCGEEVGDTWCLRPGGCRCRGQPRRAPGTSSGSTYRLSNPCR